MKQNPATNARKTPVQTRSRLMVEAILDAATRVLVSDGYGRLTTNKVAEIAGVSIGSLYQYFPNRDALVTGVAFRYSDTMKAELEAILIQTKMDSLKDATTAMIKDITLRNAKNPKLNYILNHELPRLGNMEWRVEIATKSLELAQNLLETHKSELRTDIDQGSGAFLIAKTVEAISTSMGQAEDAKLNKEKIEAALIEMLSLYLI